ncbi:MAG TPA: serine protease [Pseudonocardiaceae bacterium]|nr:serine protease [Pseudonocardiaceae bacterium]
MIVASTLAAAVLAVAIAQPAVAATAPDIVGGQPATAPWVVALVDQNGYPFCDGSLTAPNTVTTAAHCLQGRTPDRITVVGGRPDLGQVSKGDAVSGATAVHLPRDFVAPQTGDDGGTITLADPFPFPTLPPATTAYPPGTVATVYGYGSTGQTGDPLLLRKATVPIADPATCQDVYDRYVSGRAYRGTAMFCAGGQGSGWCADDAGGPLVVDGTLAGIASWNAGCGQHPDFYATVVSGGSE